MWKLKGWEGKIKQKLGNAFKADGQRSFKLEAEYLIYMAQAINSKAFSISRILEKVRPKCDSWR